MRGPRKEGARGVLVGRRCEASSAPSPPIRPTYYPTGGEVGGSGVADEGLQVDSWQPRHPHQKKERGGRLEEGR
jgi:hypothetical protein